MNSSSTNNTLEPRRDLPLHKIPELLAKITGTISTTISSSSSEHGSTVTTNDRREQLFDHYAERHRVLSLNGLLQLCYDLNIEPESYEVLLFCFLCRAKKMYLLTKDEFFLGLKNLGNHVDNLTDLRHKLFHFDALPYQNEFYLWTFNYGLIDDQRSLTTANAISLWRLFYSKCFESPTILNEWLIYLQNEVTNDIPKTITCDTWKIFPQFAKFLQLNGFDAYDDNEAWPDLFDGFVEFHRNQKKNITY